MTTTDNRETTAASLDPQPASRLELSSWMSFDFANSSYTTVIVTVAFAPYFANTVASEGNGEFLWGLAKATSEGLVVLSAPIVGAIADFTARKKLFLMITFLGCVAGTACLGLVGPGEVALGFGLFVVSNMFFSSGENLIAAFLPEITTPDKMGRISGYGWAVGYLGGLVSLAACLGVMDFSDPAAMKLVCLMVAGFFLIGGLPTMLFLKERARPKPLAVGERVVSAGFRRAGKTVRRVREYKQLYRFLLSFLLYNAGVQTVIVFASIFAQKAIGMTAGQIVIFFLVSQLSAALGAFGFGFLQDSVGAQKSIIASLVIWILVCVGAYFATTASAFYVVGNLAGLAMGSAQSGGRALVGTFSPVHRTAEFFGFWGIFAKLSAGLGPLAFATWSHFLGIRTSILLTGIFFALGVVGMLSVDEKEGRETAIRNSRGPGADD